jgi:two-component system sensor histidine kinase VicK
MSAVPEILFQTLFHHLTEPRIIVKADVPDFTVVAYNEAYATVSRSVGKDIIGKPMWNIHSVEAVHEESAATICEAMSRSVEQDKVIKLDAVRFDLQNDDGTPAKPCWWQAEYIPIKVMGTVEYLLCTTHNITEQVVGREALQNAKDLQYALLREQVLNQELSLKNKELQILNLELNKARERYTSLNNELEERVANRTNELQGSETRFRNLIEQAPVAICHLRGKELIVESANRLVLSFWGKGADIIGKPLAVALPELEGQPFLDLLNKVFESGEAYFGDAVKAMNEREGELVEGYFNFIYQPVKNEEGTTTAIMMVATDVTEQVQNRKELEWAKDTLQLSIKAAELGTFDMDLEKGTMDWDDRCRTLFGISHHNEVTYQHDFLNGLHPDDRERILEVISNVMVKAVSNGVYDVDYRTLGAEDKKLRWVRAKGKTYFDENDIPKRFIGAVLDITEQKQDEQRKNDFIGMVSHELKTPLTSLSAYLQVLQAKVQQSPDKFLTDAVTKSSTQVKKIKTMINGFLTLSRLESGKLHLHKQEFDLDALIKEILDETVLIASSHPIKYIQMGPVQVNADRDKIGSVITNLISNAMKYSPKGKEIEVSCELRSNEAYVSIRDEGMGVKPQDAEKIFDRFYRVSSVQSQHIAGFGIGLYLCSEIIERHKGKIWVDSEPEKGSTFHFTLPLM